MHLQRCLYPPLRAPKHTCRPAVATTRSRAVTVSAALKIQLGPFEFATKEAARDKIRSLLRLTYNGEMILPASEDGQLLLSLLQQHPRAAHKIGAGVSYFSTARRWDHGVATKHFVMHRIDGSSTDFSYLKCLKMAHRPRNQDAAGAAAAAVTASAAAPGLLAVAAADGVYQMNPSNSSSNSSSSSSRVRRLNHSTHSSSESSSPGSSLQSLADPTAFSSSSSSSSSSGWDIFQNNRYNRGFQYNNQDSLRRRAMRVAVAGQLQAFKTATFAQSLPAELVCPFTSEPLDPDQSRAIECDATPFLQLVDSWLQQQGIGLQDVQVGFREGQPNPYMSSTEQRWSWEDYYQQHAQLQVVSNVGFGRWQNARKGQGLFVGRRSISSSGDGHSSSSRVGSGSPSEGSGSSSSSGTSSAPASSSGGSSSSSGLGADAAAAVAAAFTTGGAVDAGQQYPSSSHTRPIARTAAEMSNGSNSGACSSSSNGAAVGSRSTSRGIAVGSNSSSGTAAAAAADGSSETGDAGNDSTSNSDISTRSRRRRASTKSDGNGPSPARSSRSAAAAAAAAEAEAEATAAGAAAAPSASSSSNDSDSLGVSAEGSPVSRRRRRRA